MPFKFQKIRSFPNVFLPLLILCLGAAIRLLFLGTVPGGMHQDEALPYLYG